MQQQRIDSVTGIILRIVAVSAAVWFLFLVRDVIALFLIAIIITAALNPIINKIVSMTIFVRTVAVSVVYIIFFVIIALLAVFILPTISGELDAFMQQITADIAKSAFLSTLLSPDDLAQTMTGSVDRLLTTTAGLFTGIISTVAVVSMSFYMSVQEDGLKKSLLMITPRQHQKYVSSLIDRIQESFGRWMAGQLLTMIFVAVLYYLALKALGVPFAGVLALLGGLLEIIPYFGPIIAAVPAIAIAFSISPVAAATIGALYLAINVIENQVLIPKIMNKAVGLNPVLVILALLIGAQIAGVVGILLAVPLAGALGVFIKDVIEKKL